MGSGGKRIGAGRKPLPVFLKRYPRKFYLNENEYKKVKEFIKRLKERGGENE